MTTNIELSDRELSDVREFTAQEEPSDAVVEAVREYIRWRKRERLIELSDQVEMEDSWRELEARELDESADD